MFTAANAAAGSPLDDRGRFAESSIASGVSAALIGALPRG